MRDDNIITTVEAAEILGVSRGTVQAWYHKGLLPGYKMGVGKTSPIRLYRDGVIRFLEAQKAAAPASHPLVAKEEPEPVSDNQPATLAQPQAEPEESP